MTNPCPSWDIDTSVAYESSTPVTFQIKATANVGQNLPKYYISDTISITITQDSDFSLDLQASDISTTNGVFMITSSRLFEIDKFLETKFNLQATNYILSTDMTSSSSAPVATTNCGSFLTSNIAGSEQSNGKIGFVIDTLSLQSPCQIRVYAEVQDYPAIYAFSSPTYISVVCGLETISLSPSISQPELIYSKGESSIQSPYTVTTGHDSSSAIYRSDISDCPITSLQRDSSTAGCSSQDKLTLIEEDITFTSTQSFQETICIKALTDTVTDSPLLFKLKVTVCGNEKLSPALLSPSQTSYLVQKDEPLTITFDSSWFEEDSTDSDEQCFQPLTYELALGQSCDGSYDPADFQINSVSNQITVTAVTPMLLTTLCLKATTKGSVTAIQKLDIEICGDEQITYSRSDPHESSFNFARSQVSHTEVINLNTLGFNFASNRANCPTIYYKLVQYEDNVQSDFNGPEISVNQISGQVQVDTLNPLFIHLAVVAYSQNSNSMIRSDSIEVEVCGYESITGLQGFSGIDATEGQGWIFSQQAFNKFFERGLNSSSCPIVRYELRNKYGFSLEDHAQQDFLMTEEYKLAVNSSLDPSQYHQYMTPYQVSVILIYPITIVCETKGLKEFKLTGDVKILKKFGIEQQLTSGNKEYLFPLNTRCAFKYDGFCKVNVLEPKVTQGTKTEYKIMLEEIVIPAISFDQPNGQECKDEITIKNSNAVLDMEQLAQNLIWYIFRNPSHSLPLEEFEIAVQEGLILTVEGILPDGSDCNYTTQTLQKNGVSLQFLQEENDQILQVIQDALEKTQEETQAFIAAEKAKGANHTIIGSNQTIELMQFLSFDVSHDQSMNMFVKIQFDKDLKPIGGHQQSAVNQISDVFSLIVISAVDDSKFQGIFVPKRQNLTSGMLCSDEHCDADHPIVLPQYDFRKFDVLMASESQLSLQFQWEYWNVSQDSIYLRLNFQYPHNVSFNNFGKDILQLEILDNELIRDKENGMFLDPLDFDQEYEELLEPRPAEPEVAEQMEEVVQKVSLIMIVITSSSLIGRIVLSKALQDVWGVLNTNIIIIHLVLFRCQMQTPSNIYTFNSLLAELTSKDVYPTDEIFAFIFKFTSKISPIEHMEILGYEGGNFVIMTGSLIINILIPIVTYLVQRLLLKLTYKFRDQKYMKRLGSEISKVDVKAAIIPLFIQGYLELVTCGILSAKQIQTKDFTGGNASDLFAVLFLILSLILLACSPLLTLIKILNNKKDLDNPEFQESWGFLYEGFRTDDLRCAIFNVIFMTRRAIMVMIIIFMHEYNGPQLIADMFLTFAYAIYIAHFRPYKDADSNKWALFNEFCGLLVRYFLFWLATFPDIDIEELDILKDIGWLYIGAVSLNIIVNFLKIGYNFLISLPSLYKQLSKKHDNYSLKEWQTNYLKKQREIMSLSLASKFERHAYYESQKIEDTQKYNQELAKLEVDHQKETQWMLQTDNPIFMQQLQDQQQKEREHLEMKYLGYTKRQIHEDGLVIVRLEINDMLGATMPHNSTLHNLWHPPYDEHYFEEEYKEYLKNASKYLQIENPSKEQEVKYANEKLCILKQEALRRFLYKEQYFFVKIQKDGNCGPRAISQFVFGTQNKHAEVREQVYQQQLTQLKKANKVEDAEFDRKHKDLLEMRGDGIWFSDIQLQQCSNLYNINIILFSIQNNMRFMDCQFLPFGFDHKQIQPTPLYMLLEDDHFSVLVHRFQKQVRKLYRDNGTKVRPYKYYQVQKSTQNENEEEIISENHKKVKASIMQFPFKPDVVEDQIETPRFTLTLKPKKVEIKKKKSRQPAEKTETPDKNIKKMASSGISNIAVHSSYPEKDNNSKSKSKEKQPKVSAIREEERRVVQVSRKTIEKLDNLKTLNSDQLREERIKVKASIRKFETDFQKLLRKYPDKHEKIESVVGEKRESVVGDLQFYFDKIKQRMSDLQISKQKRKKPKTKSKSKSKNKKLDIVQTKSDEKDSAHRPTWRPQDDPTEKNTLKNANEANLERLNREGLDAKGFGSVRERDSHLQYMKDYFQQEIAWQNAREYAEKQMKEKPKTKTKSKSKSRNKKLDIVYPKSDEEERANRPTWRPQDDPTGTTQQVDVNNLEDFGLSKEELEFKRSCEYLGADYNALKAQEKREAREEKERREAEKAKERREALYGKAKEKIEAKVKPAAMLSFGKGNKRNLSRNVPDQRGDDFEQELRELENIKQKKYKKREQFDDLD